MRFHRLLNKLSDLFQSCAFLFVQEWNGTQITESFDPCSRHFRLESLHAHTLQELPRSCGPCGLGYFMSHKEPLLNHTRAMSKTTRNGAELSNPENLTNSSNWEPRCSS